MKRLLTLGIDVFDNKLEIELIKWENLRPIIMKKFDILGDPINESIWKKVEKFIKKKKIDVVCIDAGGHRTLNVYKFCKETNFKNIYAIKGIRSEKKDIIINKIKKDNSFYLVVVSFKEAEKYLIDYHIPISDTTVLAVIAKQLADTK